MTTPSPSTELDALRNVLKVKEDEHAAAVERRRRTRDELRAVDREIQKLEAQVTTLRDIVNDADPQPDGATLSAIRPGGPRRGRSVDSNLAGIPRVQAIEIILAEAGTTELHRGQILEQLRSRGFPSERLGDTSAALAYLKRTGRVLNPARGYWRAA